MTVEAVVTFCIGLVTLLLAVWLALKKKRSRQRRAAAESIPLRRLPRDIGFDGELFSKVPPDVKIMILAQLSPQDLASVAHVCRAWHALSLDETLWESLFRKFSVSWSSLRVCCSVSASDWRPTFAANHIAQQGLLHPSVKLAPPGMHDSIMPHRFAAAAPWSPPTHRHSLLSALFRRPSSLQRIPGLVCVCGKVRPLFHALYHLETAECPVVRSGVFPGSQDVGSSIGVWADAANEAMLCALQGGEATCARYLTRADGVIVLLSKHWQTKAPALIHIVQSSCSAGTPLVVFAPISSVSASPSTIASTLNLLHLHPRQQQPCFLIQPLDLATLSGLSEALVWLVAHRQHRTRVRPVNNEEPPLFSSSKTRYSD